MATEISNKTMQENSEKYANWYRLPTSIQISNVGSEVARAIRFKNDGDEERAQNFCNKAIYFLNIIAQDPKNIKRKDEFSFRIKELQEYFFGINVYDTTDERLMAYYDAYL